MSDSRAVFDTCDQLVENLDENSRHLIDADSYELICLVWDEAQKSAHAQLPEMSRIAQSKIDQLGAKPAGLLVQNEAGRYAAVDVHGRVKWMNEDVCRCVGAGNGCCCDTCEPGEEQSSDDQSTELVFTDTAEKIDERLRYEAENDCPHCGGSGHKDDCTQGSEPPVALHQVQIRALRRNVERNCGPEMTALLDQLIAYAHAQGAEPVGVIDFSGAVQWLNLCESLAAGTEIYTQPQSAVIDWPAIHKMADEYVEGYEFRGDDGDYHPKDEERFLIQDAVLGLMVEIEDAIKLRPQSAGVPEWISVDDELPDADLEVVVFVPIVESLDLDYIDVCADTGDEWFANDPGRCITHWMLVKPPAGQERE